VQALIKAVLSVVLLYNVTFETVYVKVGPTYNVYAGMPPFNVSLATSETASGIALNFILYAQSLLSDRTSAIAFPPSTSGCKEAQDDCFSYVIPGQLDSSLIISGTKDSGNATGVQYYSEDLDVTTYVALNTIAYQLEYFPIRDVPEWDNSDCQIFGTADFVAIKICLKNVNDYLVAGNPQ